MFSLPPDLSPLLYLSLFLPLFCFRLELPGTTDLYCINLPLGAVSSQVTGAAIVRGRSFEHPGRDLTSGQPSGRQPQQRLLETEDDFSDREAEFDKFASYKGSAFDFGRLLISGGGGG